MVGSRGTRSTWPANAAPKPMTWALTSAARVASTRSSPGKPFEDGGVWRAACLSAVRAGVPAAATRASAFSTARHSSRSDACSPSMSTTTRDNGRFSLAAVTPGWAVTSSSTRLPSSSPPGSPNPCTSIQARSSPCQQCRVSVEPESPRESTLAPSRTGMVAISKLVDASDVAVLVAVLTDAPTSADVACIPIATARSGVDLATDPTVLNRYSMPSGLLLATGLAAARALGGRFCGFRGRLLFGWRGSFLGRLGSRGCIRFGRRSLRRRADCRRAGLPVQLSQHQGAGADRQDQRPLDQPGDTECAQRQRGGGRRMASAGHPALDTGRGALHSADDTVDRGAAHRARGHRGRICRATHCSTYAAYRVADTHHDSLAPADPPAERFVSVYPQTGRPAGNSKILSNIYKSRVPQQANTQKMHSWLPVNAPVFRQYDSIAVQIHHYRCMVAGGLAFALVADDLRVDDPFRQRG